MTRKLFMGLIGWFLIGCAMTQCIAQDELVPPPDVRIELPNAIYGHKIGRLYRQFKASPSPALAQKIITALERLLLEDPSARFIPGATTFGIPSHRVYSLDFAGGPLGMLSELYQYQGRYDEALALEARKGIVMMEDTMHMAVTGIPILPDPLKADPPAGLSFAIEAMEKIVAKKPNVHPLLLVQGWCVRARWKGSNPQDALVSFNDFAYALEGAPLAEASNDDTPKMLKRNWRAGRFTISLKNRTLVFQANLKKALVDGKEVALSRQVERTPYDLYVPLGDLLKSLGGTVRPPHKEELKDFQKHFPVSLLVVDLK